MSKRKNRVSQPVVNHAANGNGHPANRSSLPVMNAEQKGLADFQDIVFNVLTSRQELINSFMDPRRDINKECGYPADDARIDAQAYRTMFDREPVAARVVKMLPEECWQHTPEVYESDDAETNTPFEEAWDKLGQTLRGGSKYQDENGSIIWEYLKRGDELSRIGHFGVILLGINDGQMLEQPVKLKQMQTDTPTKDNDTKDTTGISTTMGSGDPAAAVQPIGTSGTDLQYLPIQLAPFQPPQNQTEPKLLFMRVFDESLVRIVQYEANINNPRFGMPVTYQITLNDPRNQHSGIGLPLATVRVHWTRVIHIADNINSSEIYGTPAMQQVWNRLLDLRKLYAGSAEMYWRGAFPGLSIETHPQLGGDVKINPMQIQNQMTNYMNGLQRYFALMGMTAKSLAPQVVDPTPQILTQIQAICILIGAPQRIFMGSERGELASSQDDSTWNGRLAYRQNAYLTPRVIVPFVDRMIQIGVLPEPEGYSVKWPDLDSLTAAEQATLALQMTQAAAAYVTGQVETIMEPMDWYTIVLGLTDEQAKKVYENAQKHLVDSYPESPDAEDGGEILPGHAPAEPVPEPEPGSPIAMGPGQTLVSPDGATKLQTTPHAPFPPKAK